MVMNKRGLSQVVTTVIIILLVLAAIAIIWSFVRPVIESSSQQISADCSTIDLEVASCTTDGTSYVIKRNVGQGDLIGYKVISKDGFVTDVKNKLNELESSVAVALPSGHMDNSTLRVAAVTAQKTCDPLRAAVTCA